MSRRAFQFLASALVACLLVVSSSLASQAVQHAVHHANHHAATHATAICTWFCAAGEIHQGLTLLVAGDVTFLGLTDRPIPITAQVIPSVEFPARGPPLSVA